MQQIKDYHLNNVYDMFSSGILILD